MKDNTHSATGPALGYYYQAIFALVCLFDSKDDNAFVSIETFDDVYHEDGTQKTLHQLKHSIQLDTKISIKSEQLWSTLKVWCDFIIVNDSKDGLFTLSTVATIDLDSPLNIFKDADSERDSLETLLLQEAQSVIGKRKEVERTNSSNIVNGTKEKKLPFENKYKGCEAFISLDSEKRRYLLKNTRINTSSFTLSEAKDEVIKRIKVFTLSKNYAVLSESIIAWWDREAVRSLTRERNECIFYSELQEFISRKNAELYNDGFTDDIDDMELPPVKICHPIHLKQLKIINATDTQEKRSLITEMKARIQREIWMRNNLPAASKLRKYDELIVEEWSFVFNEVKDVSSGMTEEQKKEEGRKILDWSHKEAHQQIKNISQHYTNPNLIRGSYHILSKDMRVGWHCDYDSLIKMGKEDE